MGVLKIKLQYIVKRTTSADERYLRDAEMRDGRTHRENHKDSAPLAGLGYAVEYSEFLDLGCKAMAR